MSEMYMDPSEPETPTPTGEASAASAAGAGASAAAAGAKDAPDDASGPTWVTPELAGYLKKTRSKVFVRGDKILEASCDQTALRTLSMLLEGNVMSCPVFYQKYSAAGDGADAAVVAPVGNPEYLGFVDVMDLAALALKTGMKTTPTGGLLDRLARWFDPDTSGSVAHAINLSRADRFWTCQPTTSLGKVAALMAERVHRVAVCDPETRMVVGIISQSGLLAKIVENIDLLGDAHSKPISECFPKIGHMEVLSVGQGVPARTAFEVMLANNVSGVALVDSAGRMVTNMSASDIRMMAKQSIEKFDVLDLPALEFVAQMRKAAAEAGVRASSFVASAERKVDRSITVEPTDSLGTVMNLMASSKLHRVYVLDAEGHPIGVVSITDIMGLLSGRKVL